MLRYLSQCWKWYDFVSSAFRGFFADTRVKFDGTEVVHAVLSDKQATVDSMLSDGASILGTAI